jgi:channel protein (hemolysin III family)
LASLPVSELVSAATHLLGAICAAVLGAGLIRRGRGPEQVVSLAIYVAGVVAMFTLSGAYHLSGEAARPALQRLDHAAIWLQIAGTFTPIHIVFFRGVWRWAPLVVVWTGAGVGVVLKLFYFGAVAESPGVLLYLGLGWFGILSAVQLVRERGLSTIAPVFLGGVWYSTGAVSELAGWPAVLGGAFGPHQLFHLFVLAGVAHHWSFIHRWAGADLAPIPLAAPEPSAA